MYKCEVCKKQTAPNIPQMKMPIKISVKPKGNRIVGEIKMCPECRNDWTAKKTLEFVRSLGWGKFEKNLVFK